MQADVFDVSTNCGRRRSLSKRANSIRQSFYNLMFEILLNYIGNRSPVRLSINNTRHSQASLLPITMFTVLFLKLGTSARPLEELPTTPSQCWMQEK